MTSHSSPMPERRPNWPKQVTDRIFHKHVEEELGIYEAIIASSDDAIISKTLEGIITSWNQAAERLFGYTAQEAVGQSILLIIPPDLHYEEDGILSKLRQGQRIEHYETTRRRKDGTLISVSLSISPVWDRSGTIIGATKIARNITERKREAEERLRLAALVDSADVPIFSKTREGIITSWNKAAEQMYGYTAQEIVGQPVTLLFPDDRQEESASIMQQILRGERVQLFETVRCRKDGTQIPVSVVVSPIHNEQGRVIGASDIAHDITERLQAEQRKDAFIHMASHELKTPITSLKGFTAILQRRLSKQGDEQSLLYLGRIDAQLNKLTTLVSELLDMSRMQSGSLPFRLQACEFDALVEEVVNDMQAATTTHQLRVEGRTGALVSADPERLTQVLLNVLTNAIKYSPRAQEVIVRRWCENEQVIVSVQDFGIGIDQSHHERIFERFYQVEDAVEKTYPGLGIGLYISSEIMRQHQGHIWVESHKGEGSTFFMALPVLAERTSV
jgi:PAS domain S-box-containing protein